VFARADGDHHDLAELDLATGAVRTIAREPHGAFVAIPRVSPDGTRIVATRFDGHHFHIVLVDARDGRLLATLPTNAEPVHDASWVDDHRVVFLGGAPADAGFQVYDYDLDSGKIRKLTQAPFLAFQPSATGGQTLRFLNREGWQWTLDEIPLPPRAPPPPVKIESAPPVAATPPLPENEEPASAPNGAPPPTTTNDAAAPAAREVIPPGPVAALAAAPTQPVSPPEASAGPVAVNIIPPSVADTPARLTDHLFIPQLYGPTVTYAGREATFLGGVLSGGDRMDRQRWAVAGYFQVGVDAGNGGGSFAYSNRLLAPLTLSIAGSRFSFADTPPVLNGNTITSSDYTLHRRDSELTVDAERLFYDNPVSLGFAFVESWRPDDPAVLLPRLRIGGPHLSAAYQGAATSPYTGASRLFFASIDAAAYPVSLSSAGFGFADLRGEVAAIVPLPFNRRHTLLFDLRGRDLAGSPEGEGLLRVGGYVLEPLARHARTPEVPLTDYPYLPRDALFVEPLRGFEDYPFAVNRIAIGSVTYRLPIIIDYGWASTFALLPALFVRQVNVNLFAVTAGDGHTASHSAAGGSVSVSVLFWVVPITVQYQLARRLTDDRAVVHLVQIGL
jgi:hypothetical protein